MPTALFDPRRSVFVLVDMQNDVIYGTWWTLHPPRERVVESCVRLLHVARDTGMPVIFIRVMYKADGSDMPAFLRGGKQVKPEYLVAGTQGTEIIEELTPLPGERIAIKNLVSAFDAKPFPEHLDELGVDTLLVGGVASSGGVEATVRDAHARGYKTIVVEDCCAGLSAESHERCINEVFPPMATIVSLEAAVSVLRGEG